MGAGDSYRGNLFFIHFPVGKTFADHPVCILDPGGGVLLAVAFGKTLDPGVGNGSLREYFRGIEIEDDSMGAVDSDFDSDELHARG